MTTYSTIVLIKLAQDIYIVLNMSVASLLLLRRLACQGYNADCSLTNIAALINAWPLFVEI
jgi:hypothetical protein